MYVIEHLRQMRNQHKTAISCSFAYIFCLWWCRINYNLRFYENFQWMPFCNRHFIFIICM